MMNPDTGAIGHTIAQTDFEAQQLKDVPREQSIDREQIESIKLLVDVLRIDDEHWAAIVCGVLLAYVERRNGLPEWWVWTRFAATFGRNGNAYDTWLASDNLMNLLVCFQALQQFETENWWKRWRARRLQKKVYRKLLSIGATLNHNALAWCDRYDFEKYQRQARG